MQSNHLICLWKEHKAYLKEEAAAARMWEHNERVGYKKDSPLERAVEQVFENIKDDVGFYRGVLSGSPDAFDRVRARAGMGPIADHISPVSYKDRQGELHFPFDDALELARRFCAAEPSTILVSVESTEREWAEKASRGETYIISLLNEYRASWALLRQWAGQDAAIAAREEQIKKLERLVWDAVYALQKAGLDKESSRLRQALEKR